MRWHKGCQYVKYNRRLLTRRSLSARSLSEAGELKCSTQPCLEYRSYIWLGSTVGRRDLYFFFRWSTFIVGRDPRNLSSSFLISFWLTSCQLIQYMVFICAFKCWENIKLGLCWTWSTSLMQQPLLISHQSCFYRRAFSVLACSPGSIWFHRSWFNFWCIFFPLGVSCCTFPSQTWKSAVALLVTVAAVPISPGGAERQTAVSWMQ